MKVQFLGTGATEGIPSVFCNCPVCQRARKSGGQDVRHRCSLLINDELLVDFSPDFFSLALRYQLDPTVLRYIAVTHTHNDHFYPQELRNLRQPYSMRSGCEPLLLLGSSEVKRTFYEELGEFEVERLRDQLQMVTLRAFQPRSFGGYTLTPLRARHCSGAFIFLIEHDGRSVLYAVDTGFLPEDTWDYLRGRYLNLVILDCNNPVNSDTSNHMTIEDNITTTHRLFQQKNTDNSTRFIASHFAHNCGLSHHEIEERLGLYAIETGWDGMVVKIK